MKCFSCGYENIDGVEYCSNCNQYVGAVPVNEVPAVSDPLVEASKPDVSAAYSSQPAHSAPYSYGAQTTYSAPYSYNSASAPTTLYPYQYPYYYMPVAQKPKQPVTITDAYIIIGFVLAVVGMFNYAMILLPASIGFSVVGFVKRTNVRTQGLSIAGIVVGVVSCLIKIGMVLNELEVIPDWLSAGIFW